MKGGSATRTRQGNARNEGTCQVPTVAAALYDPKDNAPSAGTPAGTTGR